MSEPTELQHVSLNSLKNSIPAGTKLKALAYSVVPGTLEGRKPDIVASRTVVKEGLEINERFFIDHTGKVRPAK